MTPRSRYRLATGWIWLLSLLRAIDLGLLVGTGGLRQPYVASTLLRLTELLMHVAVLAGLRGRRPWGWKAATLWYPLWIALMSVRLYDGNNATLALLWTPLLLLTAAAHSLLANAEVRDAFGVHARSWRVLARWFPYLVQPGALVLGLSYAFDLQTALCLGVFAASASASAPWVYGT